MLMLVSLGRPTFGSVLSQEDAAATESCMEEIMVGVVCLQRVLAELSALPGYEYNIIVIEYDSVHEFCTLLYEYKSLALDPGTTPRS
jgi:hypothetical protein